MNGRIIQMIDVPEPEFEGVACMAIDAFKKIESRDQLPVRHIDWIKEKAEDPMILDVTMEDHSHVRYIYDGLTVKEI